MSDEVSAPPAADPDTASSTTTAVAVEVEVDNATAAVASSGARHAGKEARSDDGTSQLSPEDLDRRLRKARKLRRDQLNRSRAYRLRPKKIEPQNVAVEALDFNSREGNRRSRRREIGLVARFDDLRVE